MTRRYLAMFFGALGIVSAASLISAAVVTVRVMELPVFDHPYAIALTGLVLISGVATAIVASAFDPATFAARHGVAVAVISLLVFCIALGLFTGMRRALPGDLLTLRYMTSALGIALMLVLPVAVVGALGGHWIARRRTAA